MIMGIRADWMVVAVSRLRYVALVRSFSNARFVVTSEKPSPTKAQWLSSAMSSTTVRCFFRPPVTKGVLNVPVILGSMPAPEMFLPISRTTSTSASGNRNRGIRLLAYCSSAGSRSNISSAGITSSRQVRSFSFSMIATPKAMRQLSNTCLAYWGIRTAMAPKPERCSESAPSRLPMPMAIIFTRPDS